jgi:transposase
MKQNYSEEFKASAVRMVLAEGLARTEVARRLEVPSQNISRWVKEHQEQQQDLNHDGESKSLLKKKIQELEKENRRLKMEQDILKKAAAFFAKDVL